MRASILFGASSFALLNWLKMISSTRGAEKMAISKARLGLDENSASLGSLLSISIWFGIITGFGEGFGLLLFQRINWRQWARVMHVSKEILWISPVVDLCYFLLIGIIIALVSRIIHRVPAARVLVFFLAFLTAYDWVMLTGH